MRKKNTLIVTIEGGGNIPPIYGFAKKLKDTGHNINILSEPCMKESAIELGASFIPYREHFLREDRKKDLFKDWNANLLNNPVFETVMFGPAEYVIGHTIELIRSRSIDLLVVDFLLFPAVIAAKYMKIPVVILHHMPEMLPGTNRPPGNMALRPGSGFFYRVRDQILGKLFFLKLNEFKSKLNEIMVSLSMEPLQNTSDLINNADLKLIQTLKSFDIPVEPALKNVRYTGPVLDDPDWAAPDKWENPWPDQKEKPIVVVTFSSTFQNQKKAIQNCIHAIADLPVNGIVTLGPAMEDIELSCPNNVVVMKSVKHSLLFPHVDLVITHGGHGTIMKSLANGLPLICLPMGRDQGDNAIKVELCNAGIKLSPKSTSKKIKQTIEQILFDVRYRQNAMDMKRKLLSNDGLDDVLIEINELVANDRKQAII
jgi:MGT family glycosyltransferase